MSELIQASNLSEAWLRTYEVARKAEKGRRVHLVTAVANPGQEVLDVRAALDRALKERNKYSIDTVAETIFPSSLYPDPGLSWTPGISPEDEDKLDAAAAELYDTYLEILPSLRSLSANSRGTYFSRMISWPGKQADGINQLNARVERLRGDARLNRRTGNTLDVDVAADAIEPLRGLQVYAADDNRIMSFPCLTHIDFTLLNGVLHCTAVYRHQYLIEKSYGNMVGLSALMEFICQQAGCELGELVVHATLADAQPNLLKKQDRDDLLAAATSALEAAASV